MPLTKQDAVSARHGQLLYHATARNRDGTALRCRINGRCQTWKTRPEDFKLPVKYGLKQCFYITPSNAAEWSTAEQRMDEEDAGRAFLGEQGEQA